MKSYLFPSIRRGLPPPRIPCSSVVRWVSRTTHTAIRLSTPELHYVNLPNGQPYLETFEGGNVDLRVPYIGYSSESESYTAAGISAYNALQTHVEKRMSHGLQVGFSYTYSHATDEQSALGLFYNGNNPLDLRSGYGLSDFDRKHVMNFTYTYELPKFFSSSS